jgi:hypothetical protein
MGAISFPKGLYSDGDSLTIKAFYGGINTIKAEYDIADSQAASCYNVYNAELMGLNTRYGYTRYYASSFVGTGLNALFTHDGLTTSTFLFAAGGILYEDLGSGVSATEVFSGIGTGIIRSFAMEGNTYALDGSKYIIYNSSGATTVSPYVPTYWIDTNADGTGGGQLDELNFLTAAFIQTFNGDGYSTSFYLQIPNITGSSFIVLVNDVTQVSGAATAGYTVNYASSIFSLTSAPTTGIGTVSIQAYLGSGYALDATEITKCTIPVTYGIGNAINVYLAGNPDHPARIYWSYLLDPTYYPASSYAEVGVMNDPITGLLGHANSLLIYKYDSIQAWNGVPPNNTLTEIYVGEGCIATDSLRLVNGYPTCFSQRGVCVLEKDGLGYVLTLISEDANGIPGIRDGMMTETLADRETSYGWVHDKKYWLYLNEQIWIYEYNLVHQEDGRVVYPWIPWRSTLNFADFKNFAIKDLRLYFSGNGNFFMFDPYRNDDDGHSVDHYWLGKRFMIGDSYDVIKSFDYQYWYLIAYPNIVTSDVFLTNMVGNVAGTKICTMTPNVVVSAPVEYTVRQPIHYKSTYVQYCLFSNTVSGGFALQSTKILYQADRKNITV